MQVDTSGKIVRRIAMQHPFPPYHAALVLTGDDQPCAIWSALLACVRNDRVQLQRIALGARRSQSNETFTARAADGTVWWTIPNADTVAHLREDGSVGTLTLAANAEPTGVASAPDGTLWVVETGANRLVHIDAQSERLINEVPIKRGNVVLSSPK
jgi:streptogramin lyase